MPSASPTSSARSHSRNNSYRISEVGGPYPVSPQRRGVLGFPIRHVGSGGPVLRQMLCNHGTGAHSSSSGRISGSPLESPHTPGPIAAYTTRQPVCHDLAHVSWGGRFFPAGTDGQNPLTQVNRNTPNSPCICASAFPHIHRLWTRGESTGMRVWQYTPATPVLSCSHLGHRPSDLAAAIAPERVYHLTSVLHGILVPHQPRGPW